MTNTTTATAIPKPTPIQPDDLRSEGERARKLSSDVDGVKSLIEGVRLVDDMVLAQVLFALWDSGFYEYSLSHPQFNLSQAADDLQLDPAILGWLLDHLAGRGILQYDNDQLGLTPRGVRLSNILVQGMMNLYIGGWGPQLANIGPLLRKEIPLADFRQLRSGRHTVKGTEQLISVRTVPAVLQILAKRKPKGVLQLACRTGEFLLELARSVPELRGIGIEKDAQRVFSAQSKARQRGVDPRLQFVNAEFGRDPVPLDRDSISTIDMVIALYLLHEVGRHGRQKIVEFLREIKAMFPGRLFLSMETLPAESQLPGKKPPSTFSQLDYLLVHRMRAQGMPLPAAEWKSIFEEAGLKLLEVQEVYGSGLYLAEL